MILFIDDETQSAADLTKVGTVNYARDPFFRINCIGYSIDGGQVYVIPRDQCGKRSDLPQHFVDAFMSADRIVAHNAEFEIITLREAYGLERPLHIWHCTQARARYYGYPGSLDAAARALKCSSLKAVHLKENMLRLSNPMYTHEEFPEEFQKLYEYNAADLPPMIEIYNKLPDMPQFVQDNWVLDTKINMRGVPVDLQVIDNAIALRAECAEAANYEIKGLTCHAKNYVETVHQTDRIVAFMAEQGVDMVDCTADTVEKTLARYDGPYRRVLELRQEAGLISLSKYATMKGEQASGRIYLAHSWYGTHTGRPTGSNSQMLNFPRPQSKEGSPYWAQVIADTPWMIPQLDQPLEKLKDGLRGTIKAAPGHVLMGLDQSQAEAKATAFLAGDEVLMQLFRTSDPYCTYGETMFGHKIDKKLHPEKRNAAKAEVLAFGFAGGIAAGQRIGTNYKMDFHAMADVVMPLASEMEIMRANWSYGRYREGLPMKPLSTREGVAVDIMKQWYRRDFTRVVEYWEEIEHAFLNGGQAGQVHIEVSGDDRIVTLPSGRQLFYRDVRISGTNKYGGANYSYMARYKRERLWKGQLIENWAQAHSTDINNFYKPIIEDTIGGIIHHCYDDITLEVPEHLQLWAMYQLKAITQEFKPPFVGNTPLGFDFWQGERYAK